MTPDEKLLKRAWEEANNSVYGPCCACGINDETVRNVVPNKRGLAGISWGCPECDLPADGAFHVLCDACEKVGAEPRGACAAYWRNE